jgi:hypothetical protein
MQISQLRQHNESQSVAQGSAGSFRIIVILNNAFNKEPNCLASHSSPQSSNTCW